MKPVRKCYAWIAVLTMAIVGATGSAGWAQDGARIIGPFPPRPMPLPRPILQLPERVWVEPVYRTIYERAWMEESIQSTPQRTWVPTCYMYQPVSDGLGNVVYQEVLAPGHYETTWRTVRVPGHWETIATRVLVTPGHWEPGPEPMPLPRPAPSGVPSVGVDGYSPGRGDPDAGKFSPLSEWPK